MPNKLKNERSPYLKQHEDNPVEWYPWSKISLDIAKKQKKPIFLSVGYASCHWCHVMAHESFENVETAKLLNEKFINIKVDREERPDIDSIFQKSLSILTGAQGGWPLSMFLDENGVPFTGGTYFPPKEMYGRPSFNQIILNVSTGGTNAITITPANLRGGTTITLNAPGESVQCIFKNSNWNVIGGNGFVIA